MQALCVEAGVGDLELADFDSPHYKIRAEAKRNINHSVDAMKRRHDKGARVKEWKLDDLVGVLLKPNDRKRAGVSNVPGIVVEVLASGYRVRYDAHHHDSIFHCHSLRVAKGLLTGLYGGDNFVTLPEKSATYASLLKLRGQNWKGVTKIALSSAVEMPGTR
jgi:hypothetical protein